MVPVDEETVLADGVAVGVDRVDDKTTTFPGTREEEAAAAVAVDHRRDFANPRRILFRRAPTEVVVVVVAAERTTRAEAVDEATGTVPTLGRGIHLAHQ